MAYQKVNHPERPCCICQAKFKPKTTQSPVCEAEDCKRAYKKAYEREFHKEYRKRPESRERKNRIQRERYGSDPEYRERQLRHQREHYHRKKKEGAPVG